MSWRVARSLDTLLVEVNTAAPKRSRVSDGAIGDLRHQHEASSDHNPFVIVDGQGVVRARDFTHDPANGCDAGKLAEAIRQLGIAGHPALGQGAYVIWNRRIASATLDGRPWDWEPYSGSNPHDHHCHVSVSRAPAGFDSVKRWGVMAKPKPRPPAPNHVTRMREHIAAAIREGSQTPARRKVVRAGVATLRALLRVLPAR